MISLENYVRVPAPFDFNETQFVEYERSNKFDRTNHLKKLLFMTLKQRNEDLMKCSVLLSVLSGSIVNTNKEWNTYFDLLFD